MQLDDRTTMIVEAKKDPIALSIFLLEDNPGLIRSDKNIYLYNGKCYDLIDRVQLLNMLHKFLITYGITSVWPRRTDIIESLLAYEKLVTVHKMNDYPDLICLNNGIINIHTRELIPHSPSYYFDSLVTIDYDPKVTQCPAFEKYLDDTFDGDQDTIDNIIMLGGYLLDTSCKANKMFLFDGSGGNGKSVLIDTYSMFFSDSPLHPQVTAISLEDLAGDKFKKFDLITSRFNLSSETKKGYLDVEEIKKIISGELINVRGLYKDTITFRPKTKIVLAANGLPKFTDQSDGIMRRLIIVKFKNQYKDPAEIEKIKYAKEKRIFPWDLELPNKIKAEQSAILNLFLDGLLQLQQRKYQFIMGDSYDKALSDFRRDNDTVREFLEENYEVDVDGEIAIQDIYSHYRLWYRYNVQDSSIMKFRANEMGKRIHETFGIEAKGRCVIQNINTQEYEKVSIYGLKRIIIEKPDDYFPIEEAIEDNTLGI